MCDRRPAGFLQHFGGLRAGPRPHKSALGGILAAVIVWLLWLVLALGAACAVQTKLGWYVLPALIPVALLGGTVLGYGFARVGRAERYCAGLACAALVLLAAEIPARWQV